MQVPKAIRRLFAVPAACLFLFLGLDLWFGVDAARRAGNPLHEGDVCSADPLSRPVRERCESQSRAVFAASASAASLVLLVAAYLAVNWLTARVWSGRLPFMTGCLWGYRIALGASAAALAVFVALLYPMAFVLTFMRLLGFYSLGVDNFVIGLYSMSVVFMLVGIFRRDPGPPLPNQLKLDGTVIAEREQPQLFEAMRRIARSAKCEVPRHIVLGLDPGMIWTALPVHVEGGTVLMGGTLYLSLIYHRLLSESELTSMIMIALIPSQIVSAKSEAFAVTIGKRWEIRRRQWQTVPWVAGTMTLVWYWLDLWAHWQSNLRTLAIRRATVLSGRENVAAALSKTNSLARRWQPFVHEIQTSLRLSRLQPAGLNLASMCAERMNEVSGELANEVSPNVCLALGVDIDDMKRRIADMRPAQPAEWLTDVESLEKSLSATLIKRIVFFRQSADLEPQAE